MSKSLKKLIDINRLREFKNKLVGTGSAYVQTGAVDQTIAGTKTFSKPIVGSVTGSSGSCTGNAATATTAATATNATYTNWLRTTSHPDYLFHADWDGAYFWTYVNDPAGGYVGVRVARSDSAATAQACTGNAASANIATKATQDAAGNTITTTYATKAENNTKANNSEVVHKSGDETIAGTKTFSNGVLLTNANALMAQYGGYTLVLRNDGSNTYLLISDKDGVPGTWSSAIPFVISNSTGVCDINGNAATATTATTATNATYTNWLRTSSHPDYLFHADWDGAYFWTYVNDPAGNYVPVRVARSDSSGNADTATKLATTRTIALSGAATGTATSFDGSGNITIPVTALAASAIRAQWYAAYPDGPEAHNAMWGGRDITAAFNNGTVSANITNGTFRDIFPGDYITKQVTIPRVYADNGVTVIFEGGTYTVNWVIADCDYWINKGDTATTAHHVVIVPQAPIFDTRMNVTNTTEGGYAGSEMYRKIIPACAAGIISAFGSDHILTFRDGISNRVDAFISSGVTQLTGTPGWWGEWVSVQCNLMSEKMVYGAPVCAAGAMDNSIATRQMSAFRLSEMLINYNHQGWWLRDVVSSALFALVGGAGNALESNASDVEGVRPFALLV